MDTLQNQPIRGPHTIPRARQVSNQTHHIFGIKPGLRKIIVESSLEADAAFRFEGNPKVKAYTEQDPKIPVSRKGSRNTTLDFSVRYIDGSETFFEVKPEEDLVENQYGELAPVNWDAIQQWANDTAHRVAFITDKDIAIEKHTIQNWRSLLPYAHIAKEKAKPKLSLEIFEAVLHQPGITFNQLSQQIAYENKEAITPELALHFHTGKLHANLHKVMFNRNTPIHPCDSPIAIKTEAA